MATWRDVMRMAQELHELVGEVAPQGHADERPQYYVHRRRLKHLIADAEWYAEGEEAEKSSPIENKTAG